MQKSPWHREAPSPGRQYMLPRYVYSKYDDADNIVARINEAVSEHLLIEPAVRITVDSQYGESERLIMSIPYESHYDAISLKFSEMIYQSMIGYYYSADPKTYHFGLANYVLGGHFSNLLLREMEKLIGQYQKREDMAGRLVKGTELVCESETAAGENFLNHVLIEGLDITVGFRLVLFGKHVNSNSIFIPFDTGLSVIDQIYYNMENVVMQNLAIYDELNDKDQLKISNTLIFKEVVNILKRAKNKETTRKKLLNDLVFPTSLTDDMSQLYGKLIGDEVYDTLNHVNEDRIRAARDRSRDLYNAFVIKTTEATNNAVDVSKLKIGDPVHFPIKTAIPVRKEDIDERPKTTTGGGKPSKDDEDFKDI